MKYRAQFPCRCKRCRARRTLPKKPNEYVIERFARCYQCGGELSVDWYRKRKEHQRTTCHCDGVHYPHRAGSSVWCVKHPTGPTDEDYQDRYQTLPTFNFS